jgi:hypothetical protein
LLLFSGVLLGVGMHHMVVIGTCSSTGYSAHYGPVKHCPSGTAWWMAFLVAGIFGAIAGGMMAGSLGLIFAGIFGGIGIGALSVAFDSSAHSSNKMFGAIFGGVFAVVGIGAFVFVLGSAINGLRGSRAQPARTPKPGPASAFGTPTAAAAFGGSGNDSDPIMSAYQAISGSAAPRERARSHVSSSGGAMPKSSASAGSSGASALGLIPGLQAAANHAAPGEAVNKLSKLAELHEKGDLSDQEFASAKAKLLEEM